MTPTLSSNFDELRWIINIRRSIEDELEDDFEIPVCIFSVPKTLKSIDPDSYTPQQVALGPYHYWRPELNEMERYKLSAAKRAQKQLQNLKFHDLVEQVMKLESKIRACYDKYLDFNGETLAWMMGMDASFLLEFLQIYACKEGKMLSKVSSRMSHLLDCATRKSAHNAILRDIVMLENQIPLFVLRKMLEFQFQSLKSADDMLFSMLMGLCKELSPFKMTEYMPRNKVLEHVHLLDLLYHILVPQVEESYEIIDEVEDQIQDKQENEESSVDSSSIKQFLSVIWELLSKLSIGPIGFIKTVISQPVQVILKLPWKNLSNLLGCGILKKLLEYLLLFGQSNQETEKENESSSKDTPPLIEEITIPSVTQLSKAGVRFLPSRGNILTINFDVKTITLYLPTVILDVNTEVVLRNLVAYEASNASGPVVFTRYTELMNGIIDTEEDVKLLRQRGIILNRLKSDAEVANLWNGMSRCIRLTKVPFLDKVIEDVNKYHDSRCKVKVVKFLKRYVYSSWKLLTLLAAIMLLLLTSLQAFCSVYRCGSNILYKNE